MEPNLLKFERFTLASLVIGIIISALQMKNFNESETLIVAIFGVLILLLIMGLVLLISRKKSKVAKWLWAIIFTAGLVIYIPELGKMLSDGASGILSAIQLVLQCIGMYFLFFDKENTNK